jgi:hypothetical protein
MLSRLAFEPVACIRSGVKGGPEILFVQTFEFEDLRLEIALRYINLKRKCVVQDRCLAAFFGCAGCSASWS